MKKLRCLIIDDEDLARDVLEEYVGQVQDLELVGKCQNALQALSYVNTDAVDLIFLDIQMPGILGTSFARSLSDGPKVIFTTAFSDYAVEGFELNAVDYLLKPFSFSRFLQAVNKAFSIAKPEIKSSAIATNEESGFIYIKCDGMMTKIHHQDILYIESFRNRIQVSTKDRVYVSYMPISGIEDRLPASKFHRVHRSYIVNLKRVEAYSQKILRIGEADIPIGREKKERLLRIIRQKFNME